MSTLSAIIPTYNRAEFLNFAIESVLNQSVSVDEIIVVDDGSTDGTRKIVENYSQKSLSIQIHYLYQDNKGPAAARNLGIAFSTCNFVAFLDSDDRWVKRKIEKQFSALLKRPEFLLCHSGEKWFRRGEHLNQKKKHLPQHGDVFKQCLGLCAVGMSTVIVNKKIFTEYGLFDETMRCCEDYDFWLRVGAFNEFFLFNEPLTIKNGGRDDQVSSIYMVGMDTFRIYSLEKLLSDNCRKLSCEKFKLTANELIRKCRIYGKGCMKHNKVSEGQSYLDKADKVEQILQTKSENYEC